jgi:hypothetical protein
MSRSTEQQLRDLFAADAAAAPERPNLAAEVRHRVRRRRMRVAWTSTAAVAAVVAAVGVLTLDRPVQQPRAHSPATVAVQHSPTPLVVTVDPPDQVKPGDPLPEAGAASCVKAYSPTTLAENAFAFDGTVTGIGPGLTNRPDRGYLDLRAVTFHINAWFKGGSGDTVIVDMTPPRNLTNAAIAETVPSYRIGTRMLVTGMPRWGGAPLDKPIAWGCGFTRYYSSDMAAEWATATR